MQHDSQAKIERIVVRHLNVPLTRPYVVSSRTIREFDPIVVELRDSMGNAGWGEALISPGYTDETREGAWGFAVEQAQALLGVSVPTAITRVNERVHQSPGAASALLAAMDMLTRHPVLASTAARTVPLLVPLQSDGAGALADEIERRLEEGYRTFKVKVGFDVRTDLERVETIQKLVAGRGLLRLDANRGFSRKDGMAFAAALQPDGIELFEQPCGSHAWEDNAAVAAVCRVPFMLDESIYGIPDIERAATIPGVTHIKLKLKKVGGVESLISALELISARGMTPVLGDGVSADIGCWFEACVAAALVRNAGEMNGFMKTERSMFLNEMPVKDGAISLPLGYWPAIDMDAVKHYSVRETHFG